MTREKEITKEAKKFAKEIDDWEIAEDVQDAFEQGARWADRTMIEKACEWLRTNLCEHYADEPIAHKMGRPISGYISFFEEPPVAVIGDFLKAMEGGRG